MQPNKHIPGPWKPGYRLLNVVAVNAKIGGEVPVCDIRGWGYLTGNGHGALGLSQDEAVAIQTANANLIAAAPDLASACREAAARLRYSGDLFHDQGLQSRAEADWAASDACYAALAKSEGRS